jgi:hypothetical protein
VTERFIIHPALMSLDLRRPLREWDEVIRQWEERQKRDAETELARRGLKP